MATASLTRQRMELHEQALVDAPRYPTGKRKATRPAISSEPKVKKPRRPRRWVHPQIESTPWTARSVHPAGLESHHKPNMSAFFSADEPPSKLSWLKPRNQVSVWEHMAEGRRRQDLAVSQAPAPCPGTDRVPVPTSAGTEPEDKKIDGRRGSTVTTNDRALSVSVNSPIPPADELPSAAKAAATGHTVSAGQPDRGAAATLQ